MRLRLNNLNKRIPSLSIFSSSFSLFSSSTSSGSDNIKEELDTDIGKYYAIATTDTAFKHMLSPSIGNNSILISFLNSFVPDFHHNKIQEAKEMSNSIPVLKTTKGKQKIMDLHVVSENGLHYIIEMQARRHSMFEERGLFYACSTYSQQLSEKDFQSRKWYLGLKPTIALHILDYDTNLVRGTNEPIDQRFVKEVQEFPMKEDQFIKHFILTDALSGQKIKDLQIIQVELPRAVKLKTMFPPSKSFTLVDWWISILYYSNQYTPELVNSYRSGELIIPDVICDALERLDLKKWNPREVSEYKNDLADMSIYQTNMAAERAEGKAEGKLEVVKRMKSKGMTTQIIAEVTGLSEETINST